MKRLYLLFLLLSLMSTAAFAQRVALRTDLLLWGTTTPNAGVETSISRHFTMALNGAYNAWKFGNDMKLNLYLIQPELRYWPCRKFEGHFLGVHGHYAYYNVGQVPFFSGMEDIIYRGDLYGGGITYGYHWVLGDRLSIETVIGGGYARMEYD
ncbi:DUF3575 domain-containing protein, partial [Bacteroides cellulosilyticus]